MDWKNFFKPTKGKLLIVLVIVLIWPNYIFEHNTCYGGGTDSTVYDAGGLSDSSCGIEAVTGFFWEFIWYKTIFSFDNAFNFILSVIVSYGVGCTAIYGFSRLKKKT